MASTQKATRILLEALGPDQVKTGKDDLYTASMDNLRYSRLPAARIFPKDEDAVEQVLRLANAHKVPLTARGAGSATTGTASPSVGGWVLDFSKWKQIHIDPVARMAYTQPGATIAEVDAAAARHGLMYAPDPGSRAHATVGGTIATNAGGMRGGKYGVTRDYVAALEGFLPTGEFVRWGAPLRKFAAGFNLRDLWVGAEGSLGIVTGAVLRLLPRPESQATCLAVFPTPEAALTCSQELLIDGLTPSALEFLDAESVGCTFAFWKKRDAKALDQLPLCLRKWVYTPHPPALLLVEVDGSDHETRRQLEAVEERVKARTNDWESAVGESTAELLWRIRRSCSQAMFELGPRKLNEDVVVPFDCQLALVDFATRLQEETGLPTPTFGHAGDGNFHVHVMYDDSDPRAVEKARDAIRRLMEHVVELGGAISGEHGIGLAKAPFLALQHGPAEIKAMQAVKQALDPNNILNPDKIWAETEPWSFPREDVRMPWDH